MEHLKRAWHEERGFAVCCRSDHQHDCQYGQRKAYQYGNTPANKTLDCDIADVIELEGEHENGKASRSQ